jgi:hypothetical protein
VVEPLVGRVIGWLIGFISLLEDINWCLACLIDRMVEPLVGFFVGSWGTLVGQSVSWLDGQLVTWLFNLFVWSWVRWLLWVGWSVGWLVG